MLRKYSEAEGLTARIIRCAIEVHKTFGPGSLESVYQESMLVELRRNGFDVASGVRVPLVFKGQRLGSDLRVDLLVDGQIVTEIKAVEGLAPVHEAQLITYLKLTRCPTGLLINFNEVLLKNGLRRFDRPDLYLERKRRLRDEPE
jgi:GxxExxY protein